MSRVAVRRAGRSIGAARAPGPLIPRIPAAERLTEVALRGVGVFVYAVFYAPIVVVIVYAFNDSRLVEVWRGFGLSWWGQTWADESIRSALTLSLWTAAANAVLATVLGTAAAIGLRNVGRRTRTGFDLVMYMTLIVPEIVIAIASLLFFVTIGLPLGPVAIIITHAVFNTSVVALICRARLAGMDRTLEEASADLGATRWVTFREVTFPQLLPAVLAGGLLAFTFSFDDVVLSTFVSAPGSTTLPIRVFSELRFGLSPKANVVATSMLAITLTAILAAQILLRRSGQQILPAEAPT
ncbi:MAG TPA: ABC transporter permease [Actinomycetota bacterium]|nr:ABC transporter permease [Actinomycetota bacterium]